MAQEALVQKTVRSFVRRCGRLTQAQRIALNTLWTRFGVECNSEYLDLSEVFPRPAPLVLEIGFGNGESLAEMAQARPHENFIGIDVHLPGVGQLLADIETRGLNNTRVICGDAVEFMSQCLPDCTLTRIQLFFPDPWPKRRHRKRRIVQRAWVSLAARKLQPNGILHMATDWEDYAVEMLRIMESEPRFENIAADRFVHRLNDRPMTRYERRGLALGHGVWEIACRRTATSHSHQDVPLGNLPG